jgi:acyl-CoA synthetase (AMP-forming)/AMP-acid ligase II
MGLIYGVIQPLYKGFLCYMMSPASFMERPLRWLQALSDKKATHSAAPNFAYDLCVRKIPPEKRATLDLSHWCMALNGAEPVRAEVLKKFAEAFQVSGFKATALCPGYGLAEATLKVTAVSYDSPPYFYPVQANALEKNKIVGATETDTNVQTLVGCGWTTIDTQIVIVNPETLKPCSPEIVGEIWVSGSTIAQGYWGKPQETQETFQAYLADTGAGPFLRTGDLGFIKDGELFVTGRLKEIILIRGRNNYPQDIELTVQNSHPALRPSCGAAFTVENKGEEKLVVVQEVERTWLRKVDIDEVKRAIRKAVVQEYDLQVYAIALIRTGSLPKTSSGKIQRRSCRAKFLEGSLEILD